MQTELWTLPALLKHHSAHLGEEAALVHDEISISYRELDDRSRKLAGRLVAAGVGKHSRIGVLMPNGIEWATVAYAALRVGAILVPLSTLLKPPELMAQLRSASVAHLVAVRNYRGRDYRGRDYVSELATELASDEPALVELGESRPRHPHLPALRQLWLSDALPTDSVPTELVEGLESSVRAADPLAIMFTSGSRGAPKGVMHTHGNALRATASGLEARCVGRGERLYIPMPFFWMGGFGGGLLTTLVAGATLLTESDPTPARTIELLERERATLFRGWPDQAAKVASDPSFEKADLSSLRPASLGPVLPEALRPKPGARANLFGMTETFGPYCGSRLDTDMPESKFGSCGQPLDGVEVRIVDPASGEPVSRGEQGEITLRGPNLMSGIVGRLREATFTPDGFYPTGDLGTFDGDGFLFYGGRTDDMFKVSGATVYPTEVEAALRSIPAIAQAYVTNLTEPSGESVGAAIVMREVMSPEDLDREARARLSSFKVPKRWALLGSLADLPTMATGKIDKPGLQALIRETGEPAISGQR